MNEPIMRTTVQQWYDLIMSIPPAHRHDTPLAATTAELDALWANCVKRPDEHGEWYTPPRPRDDINKRIMDHPVIEVDGW